MFRSFGIMLAAALVVCAAGRPAAKSTPSAAAQAALTRLPLSFEANQGQFDSAVRYVARAGTYNLLITASGPELTIPHSAPVRLWFVNANPRPVIEPVDRLGGRTDYYIGRQNWHAGVPSYARVRYRAVYPGVDLIYYGNHSLLEYDLMVAPGADPSSIAMRFEGPAHVTLSAGGDLSVEAGGEKFIEHAPYIYQEGKNGTRHEISGGYVLMADGTVRLRLGRYDHSKPLVIDPTLEYCTYLGGPGLDQVNAAKLVPGPLSLPFTPTPICQVPAGQPCGLLYIIGQTDSGSIPYINGAYNNDYNSLTDMFLQIIDTSQPGNPQWVYSSYIGGSGDDIPLGLDVDSSGIFYVAGSTTSTDFPLAGSSYQSTGGAPYQSCIVLQLDPAVYGGNSLLYASYFSGTTGADAATGIAVDANQNMYIVGTARSSDLPVSLSAFQSALWGPSDVFIAEMNPNTGALLYSSYVGGEDEDFASNILLGPNNLVYFTASTFSTEYAMAGYQYSASPFGGEDAILGVMDLTQSGPSSLVYSTYFGGADNDAVTGLAFDPEGNAIITGYTISPNLPVTPDAVQSTYGGDTDAWVAVINPNVPFTGGLLYCTYLGGSAGDAGNWVTSDVAGNIYVAGYTLSSNFPVTGNATQGTWPGGIDLFVTELRRGTGGSGGLVFSTYVGGQSTYMPTGLAVGADGTIFAAGYGGIGLPTSSASVQGGYAGGVSDGFVLVIGGLPKPVPANVPADRKKLLKGRSGAEYDK